MNRMRALPVVLQILDDGFRLYRRNLAGFLLVSTTILVVLALFVMSFMAFVRTNIGTTSGWMFLAFFVLLILSYPALLYTFAALSRATRVALDGQPIALGVALRIGPARGCGMVAFNLLFGMFASICAAIVSTVVSLPMAYLAILGAGVIAALADSSGAAAGISLVLVFVPVSSVWSMTIYGAWLASIVFAVQPFALEQRSWGAAASRAIDLLTARLGRSLLMFLGAGAIFGTLIIAYFGSLIALLSIIQARFSIDLPPLAGDVIIIVLAVASLTLLLPPLAIWMTLFYRQLAQERDGDEIVARVAAWRAATEATISYDAYRPDVPQLS